MVCVPLVTKASVPRESVRRSGFFGTEIGAVEFELQANDADVGRTQSR